MRWIAIVALAGLILFGCNKRNKDVEALRQEAVEDAVTAVLDSLEKASREQPSPAVTESVTVAAVPAPPPETTGVASVDTATADSVVPAPPVAARDADEPPPIQTGKEGFVIQIGTYVDYPLAVATAEKYQGLSYPAFIRPVDVDGKTVYRLRIGVYDSYEAAHRIGEEVKSRFSLDYWIDRNR